MTSIIKKRLVQEATNLKKSISKNFEIIKNYANIKHLLQKSKFLTQEFHILTFREGFYKLLPLPQIIENVLNFRC